jgi:hypothetical protein
MRYSEKELVLLDIISELKGQDDQEIELDAIVSWAKPRLDPAEQLRYFRSNISSSLRNLQRKLPEEGLTLRSNDMVGRGNKSVFKVAGDFEGFLKRKREELANV